MATVAITPTRMVSDTGVVITPGAGTAIVAANTNTIAYPKDGELLITIDSNHADTAATIAASDYAVASGLGSTTLAVGDTVEKLFSIGESARYKLANGSISITWAANSAGFITAWYLPKSVT
jgi:hypothetical protein